ncbi:hypothetical protein TYRP_012867 [Tyrophagus putrescentiae]|nr:hypothetical protein TYRP_012867 [Tyrophagus putrescentiae]
MSLRCAGLVRAANRKVKSLVITDKDFKDPSNLDKVKDQINYYSLASKPAMQPLMDIPGEPSFPDYPMTTRLSKWHCLKIDSTRQIDTATIEQIVNIFSAVTDLKFIFRYSVPVVALLHHPNWRCQLTNLMVDRTRLMRNQLARELISAINGLTALQYLALRWESTSTFPT